MGKPIIICPQEFEALKRRSKETDLEAALASLPTSYSELVASFKPLSTFEVKDTDGPLLALMGALLPMTYKGPEERVRDELEHLIKLRGGNMAVITKMGYSFYPDSFEAFGEIYRI
ncbi:hypothetical protein H6501_03730 [Candidatus Woesearchaeota archaeon]|nr:hypothetical protein [Nanoarchaeota archaeon]MCB9370681.1 hypothetical protein [Candidatus Woesearchaeota archaeon]USN43765.1 MAG: hypothetical protein H6500_05230 [Candidatus Woesearchaeota archaeon]